MKCTMDHIVLNVIEDATMIEFYTNVLELKPERLDKYRAGKVPFPSVRMNTTTIIDLFPKKMWAERNQSPSTTTNMNHFCITLTKSEWSRLRSRLERNKTSIDIGPVQRWGAKGAGISIYFKDPEGNVIEARYYDKQNASQDPHLPS